MLCSNPPLCSYVADIDQPDSRNRILLNREQSRELRMKCDTVYSIQCNQIAMLACKIYLGMVRDRVCKTYICSSHKNEIVKQLKETLKDVFILSQFILIAFRGKKAHAKLISFEMFVCLQRCSG